MRCGREKDLTEPVYVAHPGSVLPTFTRRTSAVEARTLLESTGWRTLGTGDWAWVLASPDDHVAVRVTPFDPAFRMFAEACLLAPPNRFVVQIDKVIPLRRKAYAVVMERLHPADEDRAKALVASLGGAAATGSLLRGSAADPGDDAALAELRKRITSLLAGGARRFRLWGGSDIRPGNVLQTSDGRLRLTDPVYVRGTSIVEAIREGRTENLGDFSRHDLEDFLCIPAFLPGPDTDALRQALGSLILTP